VDVTVSATNGAFTPGVSKIYARGSFNNWTTGAFYDGSGSSELTNNPAAPGNATNIYSGTFHNTNDANGASMDFKYYVDTGASWDNDPNRKQTMPGISGDAVNLALVYFKDLVPTTIPPVTNTVNFRVDMSAQVLSGAFTPGVNNLEARGSFQNPQWSGGFSMTNDPAGVNTNLFSGSYEVIGQPSAQFAYKYVWDASTWESPVSTGGGDRHFNLLTTNGTLTLPAVFFSDVLANDLVPIDTLVTFNVDMTNAMTTGGHAFDPTSDTLHLNGDFMGWAGGSWDIFLPQLTNNPVGSSNYSIQLTIPKGKPLILTYKYGVGIGGTGNTDNEAGFGQNHVRYIRSATGTYNMPLDRFGVMTQEASFGDLKVTPSTVGHVLVSWTGRPGVNLQSRTDLSSGSWINLPATDGLFSTNWPTGPTPTFFRLIKPGVQ
jgi:hypothetical protein